MDKQPLSISRKKKEGFLNYYFYKSGVLQVAREDGVSYAQFSEHPQRGKFAIAICLLQNSPQLSHPLINKLNIVAHDFCLILVTLSSSAMPEQDPVYPQNES